ncbi:hypothetical protein [Brachybacterium hainanense]|uniref:Uncharacterized protein n=1 Tax=Brachybacterium hainanense TaxID=1541174 RepID=A0ABV6RA08_9MICO
MDLYLATLQVVPMLFIALFLDRRHDADDARAASPFLRFFHLTIAILGLLAFSLSVFVVGAEITPPAWMGSIVSAALACAMAALSSQVLLVLRRSSAEG